ncbi:MAG: MBL fold metallo-hydrolase [Chloroflexi bacterium]|nr:MBL fold metallo-hydrolase [Chloroflexota bacterium]
MTRMFIGSLEVAVVSDGGLALDPARVFGRVSEADWRPVAPLDEHGQIPVGVNCLLIRAGERRILLDTGGGADLAAERGQNCGQLLSALAALGTDPADIDTVVISHAHWDHAGGASIRDGGRRVPTFPNASYWLWQGEWDYWMNPALPERPAFLDDALPPLVEHGRLTLTDGEVEVAPGVRIVTAPGHTPGHLIVTLTSGSEMGVYTGDMFHHPAQIEHPEWSPLFDVLPELSAETRRRVFEQARREGQILLTAHLPTPGIVRLPAGGGVEALG